MPLLECRGVRRLFGAEVVLDDVDLVVERGQRVGLVGANGCGKTTLCRLITGQDELDGGSIQIARGAVVGYLSQTPDLDDGDTVRAAAMGALAELEVLHQEFEAASHALADEGLEPAELQRRLDEQARLLAELEHRGAFDAEQRMLAVLGAFGLGVDDLDRPVRQLSGGERSRLALARLLMLGCDLLLLDEPTNHLDLAMTEWLETFLRGYPGAVLMVSHDRWFLDNVAHGIAELEGGRVTTYWFGADEAKLPPPDNPEYAAEADNAIERYGAYTHYTRVKAERRAAEWRAYASQQKELKRQEAWIRWKLNLRRQRHVAEARSRMKMIDKLDRVARPEDEPPLVHLEFEPLRRGPTDVVTLDDCTFGFDGGTLFEGLNLRLRRLERLAVMGANGSGKSTLLRLLLGELRPTRGVARLAETAEVAYYHQQHEDLDLDSTPLELIREVEPDMPIPRVRGFLARFLFFGDEVYRRVGSFSGGERSRLVLARLMLRRPNVLLLDEPTNHLDIAGREVLEEALRAFGGTIIVVSHDRYFVDRVCQRLLRLEPGGPVLFEGRYSAWEAERDAAAREAAAADEAARRERYRAHLVREREQRRAKSLRQAGAVSLDDLESQIAGAEAELEALHLQFMQPDFYRDGQQVTAAQQAGAELKRRIEQLYAVWAQLEEAGG